jgi:MFS family permease
MPIHQRRIAMLRFFLAPASDRSNSPEAADSPLNYLADLLKDTRGELGRVDSKASLLLATIGVIISALIAGLAGSKWTPLDLNIEIQWIWWAGVAVAASGVLSIAASVYPRFHQPEIPRPDVPAYYGDVAAHKDIDSFRRAIEEVSNSRERLMNQTFVLSRIVQHKYMLLRRGLQCLLLGILACVLAVVINILLGHHGG